MQITEYSEGGGLASVRQDIVLPNLRSKNMGYLVKFEFQIVTNFFNVIISYASFETYLY